MMDIESFYNTMREWLPIPPSVSLCNQKLKQQQQNTSTVSLTMQKHINVIHSFLAKFAIHINTYLTTLPTHPSIAIQVVPSVHTSHTQIIQDIQNIFFRHTNMFSNVLFHIKFFSLKHFSSFFLFFIFIFIRFIFKIFKIFKSFSFLSFRKHVIAFERKKFKN